LTDRPTVLFCNCSNANVLQADVRQQVLTALCESGADFHAVPDLCELAARGDRLLKELAQHSLIVVGCFPRAMRWLFHAGGASLGQDVEFFNMRTQSAHEIIAGLANKLATKPAKQAGPNKLSDVHEQLQARRPDDWQPWFPVIDYARCINCRQCLSFCLFGVYEESPAGGVRVAQPDKCKNNCPACARVCPEAAIIFPKYPGAPINGDQVRQADLDRQKMQLDPAEIVRRRDIYKSLRQRNAGPDKQENK
jgi:Pyruvate/2-oxoacid:ferredoxin oxidoreductase delta subunit